MQNLSELELTVERPSWPQTLRDLPPLPPECRDTGVQHHTQPFLFFAGFSLDDLRLLSISTEVIDRSIPLAEQLATVCQAATDSGDTPMTQ